MREAGLGLHAREASRLAEESGEPERPRVVRSPALSRTTAGAAAYVTEDLAAGTEQAVSRVRLVAAVCIVFATPAAAARAQEPAVDEALTVRWVGDEITRIGTLNTASNKRPPTIARAIVAWGRPSSTKRTSRVSCTLRWRDHGLRATFVSLGMAYPTTRTCVARLGVLQTAQAYGRGVRTQAGLRVGDSVERLRELHPDAYFQDGGFWLATTPAVVGSTVRSQRTWIVRALSDGGIVRRIGLRVGAAAG